MPVLQYRLSCARWRDKAIRPKIRATIPRRQVARYTRASPFGWSSCTMLDPLVGVVGRWPEQVSLQCYTFSGITFAYDKQN